MDISLAGRTAVVTGGSKGIGFAIATRFAASGADVAIVARGREALDAAVKAIGSSARGKVVGIQGDVAVAADVRRAYDEAMQALGRIDIVVNNAGTSNTSPLTTASPTRSCSSRISIKSYSPPSAHPAGSGPDRGVALVRIINVLNIGAKARRAAATRPPRSPTRARHGVDQKG